MDNKDQTCSLNNKKKIGFTNRMFAAVIIEDIIITLCILVLSIIAVLTGFMGTLPYAVALITMQQAKKTIILTAMVNKNKAENTKGGIVYDTAMTKIKNRQQDC